MCQLLFICLNIVSFSKMLHLNENKNQPSVDTVFVSPSKVNVSMLFEDSPQISTLHTHTNKKDKSIVLSVAWKMHCPYTVNKSQV